MKFSATKLRAVLLAVVILAVAAAFSLLTPGATRAQTATPTATALAAPVLTATVAGADAIELGWTAVPGAARYELYTQLVAEPGWRQLDEGDLTDTTYRHRGLTAGAVYQYAVRAVDADGQPLGPWSNFPTATAPGSGSATLTATATPTATVTATPTSGPTPTPPPGPTPTATATASALAAPVLTAQAAGRGRDRAWLDGGARCGQVCALHATGGRTRLAATGRGRPNRYDVPAPRASRPARSTSMRCARLTPAVSRWVRGRTFRRRPRLRPGIPRLLPRQRRPPDQLPLRRRPHRLLRRRF